MTEQKYGLVQMYHHANICCSLKLAEHLSMKPQQSFCVKVTCFFQDFQPFQEGCLQHFKSRLEFQSARVVLPGADKTVVTLGLKVSRHKDACLLYPGDSTRTRFQQFSC